MGDATANGQKSNGKTGTAVKGDTSKIIKKDAACKDSNKVASVNANILRNYFRIVGPNQILLHQDQPAEKMFVLFNGKLSVHEHHKKPHNITERGTCFGVISSVLKTPHHSTVKTDSYCLLQAIPGEHIPKLIGSDPEIAMHIMLILAEAGKEEEEKSKTEHEHYKKLSLTVQREVSILQNLIDESYAKFNHPALKALRHFVENSPLNIDAPKRLKVDHASLNGLINELGSAERAAQS